MNTTKPNWWGRQPWPPPHVAPDEGDPSKDPDGRMCGLVNGRILCCRSAGHKGRHATPFPGPDATPIWIMWHAGERFGSCGAVDVERGVASGLYCCREAGHGGSHQSISNAGPGMVLARWTTPIPPVDRSARTTTDGAPPAPGLESAPAPQPTGTDGMHGAYWVLTTEERAKGFVRPVRRSYRHVGTPGPKHPLRDLTAEELERHGRFGYVKFEAYPPAPASAVTGRFWTQAQIGAVGKGCGTVTTMGLAIAETYARDPGFYGSTFCCHCGTHLPVGEAGEFVWDGTDERVGT